MAVRHHFSAKLICAAIICPVIFFYSCEESVDIELNDDAHKRIVVEGRITDTPMIQTVKITQTTSYFYNQPAPAETGAFVTLSGRVTTLVLNESEQNPGYYSTENPVYGVRGTEYTLDITTSDGEHYRASDIMNDVPPIDSLGYEYEFITSSDQGYYKIKLYAQDPPGKGNIYMFNLYINDTLYNKKLTETAFQSDEYFDGKYIPGAEIYWVEEEVFISGSNRIKVEMLSISRNEFDYNLALTYETEYSGSIFSGPPANIPSNVKNLDGGMDGVGFFGASAVSSSYLNINIPSD